MRVTWYCTPEYRSTVGYDKNDVTYQGGKFSGELDWPESREFLFPGGKNSPQFTVLRVIPGKYGLVRTTLHLRIEITDANFARHATHAHECFKFHSITCTDRLHLARRTTV